jgi:hypothetical protein
MLASVKTYSERLEIAFWGFVIPLMRESLVVQALLPVALALHYKRDSLLQASKILAWAWAGLLLGFLLGYLKIHIGL